MPVQSLCSYLQLLTMPTPSLILVPARFKTGKLYTPVATTSGGVVLGASGDFNVTRATTATRVNASGLIEVVASGIPRLDYPLGGGCPALLVEPSGSNLVVQSQNWLASGWRSDATGFTITITGTTGTLDPYGTNTANAISPTSGSATHLKVGNDNSLIFTSGTVYTSSAFFKQGTGNAGRYVQLTYPASRFTQEGYANFDLQLGTVAVVSGTTADSNRAASIENYGNGWYRCRLTATCNSAGTGNGFTAVLITASGSTRALPFAGTITDVLYGWGAQTETGSIATSYIPTTTASATRNADVITLSGAVSGCIGQTEGTIYLETNSLVSGASDLFCFARATTNTVSISKNSSNIIQATVYTSGFAFNIAASGTVSGNLKIAVAYKTGDSALYINGVQIGTSSTAFSFTAALTQININPTGFFEGIGNQRISALPLYTTRLTNAQLQALTT
jgi:hypothetical protein